MSFFKKYHQFFLLPFLCLFFLTSCSDSEEGNVKSLDLLAEELTITKVDAELLLDLSILDLENKRINPDGVIWDTSDALLATVDGQGKVTVHAAGKVRVSASYAGFDDSVDIEIDETERLIKGSLFYEDRKYSSQGFIDFVKFNSVRYVTVDLLDAKGNVIETSATNAEGAFQFGHVIPENYSIRALAEINSAPAKGFTVNDMDGRVYAINQSAVVDQTEYVIKIQRDSDVAGAFNILDVFTSAAEYSKDKYLIETENLAAFWEKGNRLGTYYCSGFESGYCQNSEGIYVLSVPESKYPDTDEFDDDVLLHEFGHFILNEYFVDDSPAGCHYITTNDIDLSLAWSEGWGTFFGSSVKAWMQKNDADRISSTAISTSYVDTEGDQAIISYDLNRPALVDASPESFYYASNEVAVSKILWSVSQRYGVSKISDVLANYFIQSPNEPTNLPTFWKGLLSSNSYHESQLSVLTDIFSERHVFYQLDDFEDDDSISTSTLVQVDAENVPDHYLYKDDLSQDIDIYAFDVIAGQTYRVQTSELRNGIDTYIRILDKNGVLADINGQSMENDDAVIGRYYRLDKDPSCDEKRFFNDKASLASMLEFTANLSERYYVEVSHIATNFAKFGAIGPFGTYRLMIDQIK